MVQKWMGFMACFLLTASVLYGNETAMRSTNIDLLDDGERLVQINRGANSVSVFRVRSGGADSFRKIGEVVVGQDPRFLCVRPGEDEVWVTNSASGTIMRLDVLGRPRVRREMAIGAEPRGCVFTPNGDFLLVALRGEGKIAILKPGSGRLVREVMVGGQPEAIAVTNDGDGHDGDEWVFVTQFFAQPILRPGPAGNGLLSRGASVRNGNGDSEGRDDGRQGIVHAFGVQNGQLVNVALAPAPSGFTADRTAFCPQFNPDAHSDIFCPDPNETDPESEVITKDPQLAFPNQLHSVLIRNNSLYALSTAAQPEPPVKFNTNVQAFISTVDTQTLKEDPSRLTKLNDQIKAETQPSDPIGSLDRLFANDVVAVDADENGEEFLFVSRGGNYVIRAQSNGGGPLDIGAPDNVVRIPTGNIPTGIVASSDFDRAYVNNEVSGSFTALDLDSNEVIQEVASTSSPVPGTPEHRALMGKLAFFTALGVGNDDLLSTPIGDMEPLTHRNEASDNGWSSCASCHPDGLSDGVTWMFPTGPRQSVPMDGSWGPTPGDQRVFNWSGVRSNVRDFNNNARNVQGGEGFAKDPGSIFNHGLSNELSDGLDLMTFWLQSKVRTPNRPQTAEVVDLDEGRTAFTEHCASCHGSDKFTKSNLAFRNNPTFESNPLGGGQVLDSGVSNAGPQIIAFVLGSDSIGLLDDVGTFDSSDPLEIRGAGAAGRTALGGLGFNTPSLLGVGSTAPYFHNGAASTLGDVFSMHTLPAASGMPIAEALTTEEQEALLAFLDQLDGRTSPVSSEAEEFRRQLIGQ